jgi:hypothetical protein
MTKKDYIKIADIIVNVKTSQELAENDGSSFDFLEFLIDELSYIFEEDNKNFNEKKFRGYIYNKLNKK